MKNNPTDRRVRRTRRALQDALIKLILEKGYDAVTIEDITERADLGRTTFYLHFRDKEELLMQSIDSISEEFIEKHKAFLELSDDPRSAAENMKPKLDQHILHQIFTHARDNADLYKVMLRGEGGAKVSKRYTNIIAEETSKRLNLVRDLKIKVPLDVFAVSFSGTLIELVTWWLEEDQPYSIEEMVAYYQQIFIKGALDTLNLTEVIKN